MQWLDQVSNTLVSIITTGDGKFKRDLLLVPLQTLFLLALHCNFYMVTS